MVRPVQGNRADPRRARAPNVRESGVREAEHRGAPGHRIAVQRAVDPDDDRLRARRTTRDAGRGAPAQALRARAFRLALTTRRPARLRKHDELASKSGSEMLPPCELERLAVQTKRNAGSCDAPADRGEGACVADCGE